jgi:hypothetical protein
MPMKFKSPSQFGFRRNSRGIQTETRTAPRPAVRREPTRDRIDSFGELKKTIADTTSVKVWRMRFQLEGEDVVYVLNVDERNIVVPTGANRYAENQATEALAYANDYRRAREFAKESEELAAAQALNNAIARAMQPSTPYVDERTFVDVDATSGENYRAYRTTHAAQPFEILHTVQPIEPPNVIRPDVGFRLANQTERHVKIAAVANGVRLAKKLTPVEIAQRNAETLARALDATRTDEPKGGMTWNR